MHTRYRIPQIELPDSATVRILGPCVVLMYLAFAAYYPALSGVFIWDDIDIYIVHNPLLREPDGIYRFWFTAQPSDYYPLTYTTFWMEWQLFGAKTRPYHMFNVLLHGGCGIVLWRLLHRLGFAWGWLVAALFVLHPVNVESVAWISQRKGVLATFFGFLSLYWYQRADTADRPTCLWLAVFSFALSLSAKPTLITLPVLLLCYERWFNRGLDLAVVRRLIPFFVLALVFGAIGVWFQEVRTLVGTDTREQDIAARLATAGWAFWFYIWKLLWPMELSIVYPRWHIDAAQWVHWLPSAAMVAAFVASCALPRRWRIAVAGALGVYILTMSPVLGLVDVFFWQFSFVADHYQYQSIAALLALLVWIVVGASAQLRSAHVALKMILAVGVLALLFAQTHSRAALYVSGEALWRDAIAKNDKDFAARINLTHELMLRREWAEACELALHASVLNSKVAGSGTNAGVCLHRMGNLDAAIEQFERAHRLQPTNEGIEANLHSARVERAAQRLREQAGSKPAPTGQQ